MTQVEQKLIDDYEGLIADRDKRLGTLAADLLDEQRERVKLAEALVTVTAERDESRRYTAGIVEGAEARARRQTAALAGARAQWLIDQRRADRYRLAWMSARRRANESTLFAADLIAERDEARTEVVRLGRELESWRLAFGETALKDATDRLRAALAEVRIEPELPSFEACPNAQYPEHGAAGLCALCGKQRPS